MQDWSKHTTFHLIKTFYFIVIFAPALMQTSLIFDKKMFSYIFLLLHFYDQSCVKTFSEIFGYFVEILLTILILFDAAAELSLTRLVFP